MIDLIKEGFTAVRIAYYKLALNQMGYLHKDYPAVVLHVRALNDQLNAIRGVGSKA